MYQLNHLSGTIRRLTDGADIPESDDCQAYLEFKAWLEEGNTPLPADTPVLTPLQEIAALEADKPTTENPAVREIQALEAQIAALRAQAKEQGPI